MDHVEALAHLGLSQSEAEIFLFVLRNPRCFAPQIQAGLRLEKMSVYRALNSLKDQGFVESVGALRNQQFVAVSEQDVLGYFNQRRESLRQACEDMTQILHELRDRQHTVYKEKRITVYEGLDGWTSWNEERLRHPNGPIMEFGQHSFVLQFFASPADYFAYTQDFITRRVAKKLPIHVLTDARDRDTHFDTTSTQLLKEVRVVSMDQSLDALVSIFGKRFGFYTQEAGSYLGVIIDDPMLATLMGILFKALWNQAQPV